MKAQFSMEAMFVIIVILGLFTFLAIDTISKQKDSERLREFLEKKNTCDKFSNEVGSLFVLGNGAEGSIEISHNLNISKKTVFVEGIVCGLCCNIAKNSQDTFNLSGGWIKLKNQGGEIVVE